jgi:predicted GH43/DUF377 family glycosyl hydrolase/biotin operon repressor
MNHPVRNKTPFLVLFTLGLLIINTFIVLIPIIISADSFSVLPTDLPDRRGSPVGRVMSDGTTFYLMGGWNAYSFLNEIDRFNSTTETYQVLPATLPTGRKEMATAYDGKDIYIFGGESGGGPMTQILKFNVSTQSVTVISATLPGPRRYVGADFNGKDIYIAGGGDFSGPTADIFKFDTASGSIQTIPLKLLQSNGKTDNNVIWDGKNYYLLGGEDSSGQVSDKIWRFNPEHNTMMEMNARLPKARDDSTAAFDGQYIYLFGGYQPGNVCLGDISAYDPVKDEIYTTNTIMDKNLTNMVAGYMNGAFYIFGGYDCTAAGEQTKIRKYVPNVLPTRELKVKSIEVSSAVEEGNAGEIHVTVHNSGNALADLVDLSIYTDWPFNGSDFQRSSANPILPGVEPMVVKTERGYQMWYQAIDGKHFNYASSPDGVNWYNYNANPVLSVNSTNAWETDWIEKPMVIYNGSGYQMWYSSSDGEQFWIDYAESQDAVNWVRYSGNPVMSPGPSGSLDEHSVRHPYVIFNGTGYQMWYSMVVRPGGGQHVFRIGYATSPDGIHWSKYANNPVLDRGSGTWDAQGVLVPSVIYNKDIGQYWMWYSGHPNDYAFDGAIGYATSTDGIHWELSPSNPIMRPTPGTWESQTLYTVNVIRDDLQYKMWYSGYNASADWHIGLANCTVTGIPIDDSLFTLSADSTEIHYANLPAWASNTSLNITVVVDKNAKYKERDESDNILVKVVKSTGPLEGKIELSTGIDPKYSYHEPGENVTIFANLSLKDQTFMPQWDRLSDIPPSFGDRTGYAAVWDDAAGRIIMFGGITSSSVLKNDTWFYDPATDTWTQGPSCPCNPRKVASAVWDPINDWMIVFGGADLSGHMNDTWVFTPSTSSWIRVADGPAPRREQLAVWDQESRRMLIYSGHDQTKYFHDLWSYDTVSDTWQYLLEGPYGGEWIAGTWVPDLQGMLITGGSDGTPNNQTWLYKPSSGFWTRLTDMPGAPRYGSYITYDPVDHLVILYGGHSSPSDYYQDLFVYDPIVNKWQEKSTTNPPGAVTTGFMFWDTQTNDKAFLTPGNNGIRCTFQTWALSWLGQNLTGKPIQFKILDPKGTVNVTLNSPMDILRKANITYKLDKSALGGNYTANASFKNIWNTTTFNVSSIPPTVSSPPDINYIEDATGHWINWSCSDKNPVSYNITRNGTVLISGSWNGSSTNYSVDGLAVGSYLYELTLVDLPGNVVKDDVYVNVTSHPVPGSPPWALISNPKTDDIVQGTVIINGTAGDADDHVVGVWVIINDIHSFNATGTTNWNYTWDTTLYPDGITNISVEVKDVDDATIFKNIYVTIKNPQNVPPEVVITNPAEMATVSGIVVVNGTAKDTDGLITNISYSLGPWKWTFIGKASPWNFSWDTRTVPNGMKTIFVQATDNDGAESYFAVVNVTVSNVQNHPPTVNITSPKAGSTNGLAIVIKGTASDPDGDNFTVRVRINGSAWYNITGKKDWSFNLNAVVKYDGNYTITARATDEHGAWSEDNLTIRVENSGQPHQETTTEDTVRTVVIVAATIGAVSVAATAYGYGSTDLGRWLWFKGLLMQMYSKRKDDKVLDNFLRGMIQGIIIRDPGIRPVDVISSLESQYSDNLVYYHIHELIRFRYIYMVRRNRNGEIVRAWRGDSETLKDTIDINQEERQTDLTLKRSAILGLTLHLYPTSMVAPNSQISIRKKQRFMVYKFVAEHPGASQQEIADRLDMVRQAMAYHLKELQKDGVIVVATNGRNKFYYIDKAKAVDLRGSVSNIQVPTASLAEGHDM